MHNTEVARNTLIQELKGIEFEIVENDAWFLSVKEGKVVVTTDELSLHRKKAEELYSRKKSITDQSLPECDSTITAIVSQIQAAERQENIFQRQDLERLLIPSYETRQREQQQILAAQAKEQRRQREEEESRTREEYETHLDCLRSEESKRRRILEESGRRRILEEERREQRADEIRTHVHARNIPYLVHFTPIANMTSILRDGLRSRNSLALAGQCFVFTDEYRADGWLDWISVSVSFPNYKMFYAKKNSLIDIDGWAIMLIRREALWELDCKYILTNASSFGIRMFREEKWSTAQAFEDMFKQMEHRIGIPDSYTTDPQAEVMIKNHVPRRYIGAIAVERSLDTERLGQLPDIRVEVMPDLFRWRSDFEHWRQFRLPAFVNNGNVVAPF